MPPRASLRTASLRTASRRGGGARHRRASGSRPAASVPPAPALLVGARDPLSRGARVHVSALRVHVSARAARAPTNNDVIRVAQNTDSVKNKKN